MSEHNVILSLGSNLGNRMKKLRAAVLYLSTSGLTLTAKSRVWETKPWGVADQPLFLNMCVAAKTELEPLPLMELLKEGEAVLGRTKSRRWGPREIDIDIIFYDNLIAATPELTIPHPHVHERAFVLLPMAEIAPDARHPISGKSVKEMLDALPESEKKGMIWITPI